MKEIGKSFCKLILKTSFFVFLFVIQFSQPSLHAQTSPKNTKAKELKELINQELVPSGILLPRDLNTMIKGELTSNQWKQIYYDLSKGSYQGKEFIQPVDLQLKVSSFHRKQIIPVYLLHYIYQYADSAMIHSILSQHKNVDLPDGEIFAASASKDYSFNGSKLQFIFKDEFYFHNTGLKNILIDFDDHQSFRPVRFNTALSVSYSSTGIKLCRLKWQKANGQWEQSSFVFNVLSLTTPPPSATWQVQADSAYLGQVASGEAYLYHGQNHTSLVDPVIAIEGFDIYDSYNWEELYGVMNQQNLLTDLSLMGFDLVVLNLNDPVTYIQRNAFLVEKLIQLVNAEIAYQKQPVLIGASMGGLISRYTLMHMENTGQNHNIRTFISFDSPQKGANVPLGLQYWIEFFSTESADAAYFLQRLESPAAKQMLLYHFTDPPSSTPAPDPLFPALYNELSTMGNYPSGTRNVSIVNGSGNSLDQGYVAGSQLIDYVYNSFVVDITGNVWALPDGNLQMIFNGLIDRIWPLADDQLSVSVFTNFPLDNSPGGYRASMLELSQQQAPYGSITSLHDNHCFIPVISSLNLDTNNLFYNAFNDPLITSLSPFDQLYYPMVNQEHIFISAESKNWFLKEIMYFPTGIDMLVENDIELFPNPARSQLIIKNPNSLFKTAELFDITGKLISNLTLSSGSGTYSYLNIKQFPPGMYFLKIHTGNSKLCRKFIIAPH